MTVLAGHDRRAVLVAAHLRRPVGVAMVGIVEELAGMGLIAAQRPCDGGLELMLTPRGAREAAQQWDVMWWMRWRDAAASIFNRDASTLLERATLNRRARAARERALAAFDRMTRDMPIEDRCG